MLVLPPVVTEEERASKEKTGDWRKVEGRGGSRGGSRVSQQWMYEVQLLYVRTLTV